MIKDEEKLCPTECGQTHGDVPEEPKEEMSRDAKIAITTLYLASVRFCYEVEPGCIMENNKKGKAKEYLMNKSQLQDYVDRVLTHTIENM